jgi:hypothetical protein
MTLLREAHLPAADPAEYRAELQRLIRRLDNLEAGLDKEVAALFREMQTQIRQALLDAAGEGTRALLRLADQGLTEAITRAEQRWLRRLTDTATEAAEAGIQLAAAPLDKAFGGRILGGSGLGTTTDMLGILAGALPDLVQGVGLDLKKRIRSEIAGIVAGAQTPFDAAQKIGRSLKSANHFSTVYHRARAITVTELGRINALATQKAQEDLTRTLEAEGGFAPIAKRWLNAHLPNARPEHLDAEARYAEGGDVGPIPVDKPFIIAGIRAMYPRDPSLPPGQSVNCHCVSITVMPGIVDYKE